MCYRKVFKRWIAFCMCFTFREYSQVPILKKGCQQSLLYKAWLVFPICVALRISRHWIDHYCLRGAFWWEITLQLKAAENGETHPLARGKKLRYSCPGGTEKKVNVLEKVRVATARNGISHLFGMIVSKMLREYSRRKRVQVPVKSLSSTEVTNFILH